jgi:formyltetrahydrofolate deformylase
MSYIADQSVARLIVRCPDKSGIVCNITKFLFDHHANITMLDQHSTDPEGGTFFLRLEFQTPHLDIPKETLAQRFEEEVASKHNMSFDITYAQDFKKMAVFVSQHDHAFLDLLWRYARQELPIEIPLIISNHPDLKVHADNFNIPFYHIENNKKIRPQAEAKMLDLLRDKVDGIILARYMQILSADFTAHFPHKIINIHHSFLPAFIGADPYQQAYEKGVKLIGATAHYVTEDLDMGPIIGQDVVPVTHRLDSAHLKELGKDIERRVLAKAVKWHLEDRILVHDNKTIVFA